jgi:hypothetical protein
LLDINITHTRVRTSSSVRVNFTEGRTSSASVVSFCFLVWTIFDACRDQKFRLSQNQSVLWTVIAFKSAKTHTARPWTSLAHSQAGNFFLHSYNLVFPAHVLTGLALHTNTVPRFALQVQIWPTILSTTFRDYPPSFAKKSGASVSRIG